MSRSPIQRLIHSAIVGLVWTASAFVLYELFTTDKFDILFAIVLIVPLALISLTIRLFGPLLHLANKGLREEIALTALEPTEYLSRRLKPLVRRELLLFAPALVLMIGGLTAYELATTSEPIPQVLGAASLYALSFFLVSACSMLLLLFGFCRLLISACRSENRNRTPGFFFYGFGFLWMLLAIALPWAAIIFLLYVLGELFETSGTPPRAFLLQASFLIFLPILLLLRNSWSRACRGYFLFE